jgi:hypothetical protein
MRPALRALVAGGLGFAVSLIAACGGGSNVLSADQASALKTQLTRLQTTVAGGGCTGVQNELSQLQNEISNVANSTARANLTVGFDTLQSQVSADCQVSTPQTTPKPKTTTTTHTNTQTAPTVSTQTQTTSTTPSATTPTATGTTTNPGPGSGGAGLTPGNGSQGNGNGNGN